MAAVLELIFAVEPVPLPPWLDAGIAVGTIGLVLALWLRGWLIRNQDHQAILAGRDEYVAELERRAKGLQDRIDALVADRDAWRDAHGEEVKARAAAEFAASKLIDSTNLSAQLLEALRSTIEGK